VQGAAQSSLSGSLLVVGTTDDPKLVEAAADAGSRLVLVAWKRDDVAAQLLDAVAATIADPAAAVRRDVPCELVGAGVTSPPKDGS